MIIRRYIICFSTATAFIFLNSSGLFGQPVFPPPAEKNKLHITAVSTSQKITIDGKADEPAWKDAETVADFTTAYPVQGAKATYQTTVKLLTDDKNIYISAVCQFPPGKKKLQVQNLSRDFGFSDNELFEVLFDTYEDPSQPVPAFCVTPYGTQMDIMHYADGNYDYKWDAVWQAASVIHDHEWTTEIAIPFDALRYPPGKTQWRINFIRNTRSLGEISGWAAWPTAFSESKMEYAGLLVNIHAPAKSLDLRLEPYALLQTATNGLSKHAVIPEAGGDVKYSLSSNTRLDLTFNTDFAQADVDKQVINFGRSTVYFPEKRQFFLENAGLFSLGRNGLIQPFFSRRIGLGDDGTPLQITGGARLVLQETKQSGGVLVMQQRGDESGPGAVFAVLRYKKQVGRKLQLGALETFRENESFGGKKAFSNTVETGDMFCRLNAGLFIRGFASVSNNNTEKKAGSSAFAEINYSANVVSFDMFETYISQGYDAQTGFVGRNNIVNTQPNLYFNFHRNWFPRKLAYFSPQLTADIYHEASTGILQEADVNLTPLAFNLADLSQAGLNLSYSKELLKEDFSPVRNIAIPPGNYHYARYEFYGITNSAAKYSGEARFSSGGYYSGRLNNYYVSLRAAPSPKTAVTVSYTVAVFSGISDQRVITHLFAPQIRLAANSKISLTAFYQYNTDLRTGYLNTRFSWEYRPLCFIYLVLNSDTNYSPDLLNRPREEQGGILKLTYIYQPHR